MSKHNPNQDFYKIKGRVPSDGPDRGEPAATDETPARRTARGKRAGQERTPNFIPGEAPVGESPKE